MKTNNLCVEAQAVCVQKWGILNLKPNIHCLRYSMAIGQNMDCWSHRRWLFQMSSSTRDDVLVYYSFHDTCIHF